MTMFVVPLLASSLESLGESLQLSTIITSFVSVAAFALTVACMFVLVRAGWVSATSAIHVFEDRIERMSGFVDLRAGPTLAARGESALFQRTETGDQWETFPCKELCGAILAHGMLIRSRRRLPDCNVEQSAFGVDHAMVGAALMQHWGMPEQLIATCAQHHRPIEPEQPHAALLTLVALSDRFDAEAPADAMQWFLSLHEHAEDSLQIGRGEGFRAVGKMLEDAGIMTRRPD